MDLKKQYGRRSGLAGFSLVELSIAMAISMLMMVMAIPVLRQTVDRYRLDGAVSSVAGAIRATRYQAMMKGYRHRLAITSSNKTFQLSSMIPPAATYSDVGIALPISGSAVTLSADTTLEFRPNGRVSAVTGTMNLDISYSGVTKTIAVSTYGNITVTP
jgi:Tfp pilus assembly protein FimT